MDDLSDHKHESEVEHFGYQQELKRVLGIRDLLILGLSMAVPISVCSVYGYIIGAAHGSIALVYLIASVGMIFTGNSYARLSQAFPLAGGAYAFVSRGMNRIVGFFIGWAMVGMYMVLLPLLYIFCAFALSAVLPDIPLSVWMIGFILLSTAFNYRGIAMTQQVLRYILLGQFIIYGWVTVAGLLTVAKGLHGSELSLIPFYSGKSFSLGSIMAGVSIAVFNFGGPDALTTLGEETRGGNKTLGRGVLLTFAVLGILYVLFVYVAALVWPDYKTHVNADTAFYDIVGLAGGPVLKLAFSCAVAMTIFGCCLGVQTCTSRVLYAMGRDHMFPKVFSRIHPRYESPYLGILIIGAVALVLCLVFVDRAEVMTSMVNFSMLLVWSLVNITALYYYAIKQKGRNYFQDVACPIIGLLLIGYTFASLKTDAKMFGFLWLVIGAIFMFYLIYIKKVNAFFPPDSGV